MTPMIKTEEIDAAQAIYSPFALYVYDWVVLGLSNSLLWRCPTTVLRALYDRNITARHLDVGVGMGYSWTRPNGQSPIPRLRCST
jgi:hypothetical protein